ncbi:MAG TPA: HAD family hydrolase [Xanthomonadaceae bacterium]|nr:HAD family hydrolase [Xanthomonadaceae bacterium]
MTAKRPAMPASASRHDDRDATVSVAELGSLLARHPRVKLLSLDCFDTILWRRVDHPADVFYTLQHDPAFAAHGLDARLRVRAEQQARELAAVQRDSHEVTLDEVYRTALPGIPGDAVVALEEAELAAEIQACQALPAAVALLRDARARGIEVMVVSDTYLREPQLRRLLQACLPEDAFGAIRRIVVSSEHGVGKAGGLFTKIRDRMNLPVARMLHVGDNPLADLHPARDAGIASLQLKHLPEALEARRQYRATALRLLEPEVRARRPMPAGYHPVLAGMQHDEDDIDQAIGHASLGPMMHAFASWLLERKRALEAQGRRVKLAFLLRDGYLPHAAATALAGEDVGKPVYLSRYAAFAASFRDAGDVQRYLALFAGSAQHEAMLRQLGVEDAAAGRILAAVRNHPRPAQEFARRVLAPDLLARIVARSAAYRARLKTYLERELGLAAGDTLVFVDLGYVGTAQRVLAPMMREDWDVDLHGWYFMCTPQAGTGDSRHGLVDCSRFDARTIDTLLPFVSLLENLCTTGAGSVVDYAEDGTPRLARNSTGKQQTQKVERIQRHCLAFVRAAERHYADGAPRPGADTLRDTALAEFARMVFFPDAAELAHYDQFALELNLGTDRVVRLHDTGRSLAELRRHGLFYAARRGDDQRINTPHELRHAGMEMTLAMMSTYRYGLAFSAKDWTLREESLPVILLRGQESTRHELAARSTHDGCFRLRVPLGKGDSHAGVLFGDRYRWLQLIEARVLRVGDLHLDADPDAGIDVRDHLLLDGIEHAGDGLLHCTGQPALAMLPAGMVSSGHNLTLDLVFRPLSGREAPDMAGAADTAAACAG